MSDTNQSNQGRDARDAAQQKAQAAGSEAGEQTKAVAHDAAEQARAMGHSAHQEASALTGEAVQQARSLVGTVQDQVGRQATEQQQRAAGRARSYTDDLHRLATGEQPQNDAVRQTVAAVADRAEALTQRLETAQPLDLVDDARRFAARRPGTFLAIALGLGLVAGRATRGLRDASSEDAGARAATPRRAVDPEGVRGDVSPHHLQSQSPSHAGAPASTGRHAAGPAQGAGLPHGTEPVPTIDPVTGEAVDAPFDQTRPEGQA